MIFVKHVPINGDCADIAIKFYHVTQGDEKLRGRSTRCELIAVPTGTPLNRNNGTVIGSGATKVFSGNWRMGPDRFDRRVGRKESLDRALADAGLSKEIRSQVWQTYLKHCKIPGQSRLNYDIRDSITELRHIVEQFAYTTEQND